MFCRNCGRPLPENAAFCPNCGTALLVPKPPVEDVKETVVEEAAPAVEEVAPVVEEVAPVVEEVAPAVEEVAPAVEEVVPAVEEVAPVVKEAAPVVKEAAFVAEEAAPASEPDVFAPAPEAAYSDAAAEAIPEKTPEEKKTNGVMLLGVAGLVLSVLYGGGLLFDRIVLLILNRVVNGPWKFVVLVTNVLGFGVELIFDAALLLGGIAMGKALEMKKTAGSLDKTAKTGFVLAVVGVILVLAIWLLSSFVGMITVLVT